MKFADYYETLFKIKLSKNRVDTLRQIDFTHCSAPEYFQALDPDVDVEVLRAFTSVTTIELFR